VLLHQVVEGRLRIEHHRPELAAHLDAGLVEQAWIHLAGLVVELAQAERVG
jgi:hypothetical protein